MSNFITIFMIFSINTAYKQLYLRTHYSLLDSPSDSPPLASFFFMLLRARSLSFFSKFSSSPLETSLYFLCFLCFLFFLCFLCFFPSFLSFYLQKLLLLNHPLPILLLSFWIFSYSSSFYRISFDYTFRLKRPL